MWKVWQEIIQTVDDHRSRRTQRQLTAQTIGDSPQNRHNLPHEQRFLLYNTHSA